MKSQNIQLRAYQSSDCAQLAELFDQTVHTVNARDYTREQLDAWAGPAGMGPFFPGTPNHCCHCGRYDRRFRRHGQNGLFGQALCP